MNTQRQIPVGFDWLIELEALSSGIKKADREDADELYEKASHWPTCACGQLCTLLDKQADGEPRDRMLKELGLKFMTDIREEKWCVALKTFKSIERRTARLLKLELSNDVCPTQSVSSVG